MALHSLTTTSSAKVVTTAGTPVQLATTRTMAQSVLIQAMPINTGRIVVGLDNSIRANAAAVNPTGTVIAIIGAPSANTATPPSWDGSIPLSPSGIDLSSLWLDASVSGEGVIVSYTKQ